MELSQDLLELLDRPSICYIATTMPDGSPQLTQTWVDTDGEHVLINSVQGYAKVRNIERDPRVAVAISDPDNTRRYFQIRGRVVDVTLEGGAEHIEKLSQKYLGESYPWYGGRDQVRVIITIEADKISGMGYFRIVRMIGSSQPPNLIRRRKERVDERESEGDTMKVIETRDLTKIFGQDDSRVEALVGMIFGVSQPIARRACSPSKP